MNSFDSMKRFINIFLYPIAWVNLLSIRFRRNMFRLGKWKSVEFEVSTLSIVHESNVLDFEVIDWVNSFFNKKGEKTCAFVHVIDFETGQLELESYDNCNYLMKIKGNEGAVLNCYDTRYSKILGMSEAYVQFPDLRAFLVYESKYHTEIRNDVKLLIIETIDDLMSSSIWPLGQRKHDMLDIQQADFIIIKNDHLYEEGAWTEFLKTFNESSCITIMNTAHQNNVRVTEVAEYLSEQIDIVEDHYTFERLLIQKVGEVNSKKRCEVEN